MKFNQLFKPKAATEAVPARKIRKIKWFLVGYLLVLFGGFQALENLLYRNPSISEPLGYYLSLPLVGYGRGDLVMICINNGRYKAILNKLGLADVSGQCASGLPYLIKRIGAVKGDVVEVTASGILINGTLQANSYLYPEGRGIKLYPLAVGYKHTLSDGEYFMLGNSPHSFDSRYFGVVKQPDIYRRAILVKRESK